MSRPPGRGSALTPDERRAIQRLALVDGCSIAEIARRTDRDRGTVSAVIKADDTRALQAHLASEARDSVLQLLRANSTAVARQWLHAVTNAAEKGDHRPARDLLLHAGAIDPIQDDHTASDTRIAILIGTPEHPIRVAPPRIVNGELVNDDESDA
jgi:transposase-like protein